MYKELPWTDNFKEYFSNESLPHSVLIGGNEGLGKKDLALQFSNSLFCITQQVNSNCKICKPCKLFLDGNHPDFYQINLEEGKKNISIKQIKSLRDKIYESPFLGGNKVFYIELVEHMSKDASDSLLKILEEPPKNTFFILTSNRHNQVPATITSRCSEYVIKEPEEEKLYEWLNSSDLSKADFNTLLTLASGKPLLLEGLYKSNVLEIRLSFIKEISSLLKSSDNVIELSESWAKDKKILSYKLEWMGLLLMDAIRFQSTNSNESLAKDSSSITSYLGIKTPFNVLYDLLNQTNLLWNELTKGTNLKMEFQLQALFVDWEEKINLTSR